MSTAKAVHTIAGPAEFTGTFAVSLIDRNQDGRTNQLAVSAEISFSSPAAVEVVGRIWCDGRLLASRESWRSTAPFGVTVEAEETGIRSATLKFSGEDIHRAGVDGGYIAELTLRINGRVVDEREFPLGYFHAEDFRELPAEIRRVVEYGEDPDGDGLYEALAVEAVVSVFEPMHYSIQGAVYAPDETQPVSGASVSREAGGGTAVFLLRFAGEKMQGIGQDGPYRIRVTLLDADGVEVDTFELVTSPYACGEFE